MTVHLIGPILRTVTVIRFLYLLSLSQRGECPQCWRVLKDRFGKAGGSGHKPLPLQGEGMQRGGLR